MAQKNPKRSNSPVEGLGQTDADPGTRHERSIPEPHMRDLASAPDGPGSGADSGGDYGDGYDYRELSPSMSHTSLVSSSDSCALFSNGHLAPTNHLESQDHQSRG